MDKVHSGFGATERYSGFGWIGVKRYVMDESLTWEERYQQLDKHHVQETQFLIDEIRKLAAMIDFMDSTKANDG